MSSNREGKLNTGIGMPHQMYLHQFGSLLWEAFGSPSYLVGSALIGKSWRDVDIRFLMVDTKFDLTFPGVLGIEDCQQNGKWVAWCLAWSALGEKITGLPIDFQIQRISEANKYYDKPRSCIGIIPLRLHK